VPPPQEHDADQKSRPASLLRSDLLLDVQLPLLERKRKRNEGLKGRAKRLVKAAVFFFFFFMSLSAPPPMLKTTFPLWLSGGWV